MLKELAANPSLKEYYGPWSKIFLEEYFMEKARRDLNLKIPPPRPTIKVQLDSVENVRLERKGKDQ
jgi:hypothetical protein